MAKTYEPISTQTVGTAVATVTFTSIPQTYTDLVIAESVYYSASTSMALRFNNDSATNYSNTILGGSNAAPGSGVYSARSTNAALINIQGYYAATNSTGNIFLPAFINIMNYSNTTTYKNLISRAYAVDNGTGTDVEMFVGVWRSTNAITRIDLVTNSGNFAVGSTFTLYGIKAA
jgi:hypothetical protein